jgi:predicted nuclease of predicted toxin-antitoxin system
MRLYLDEDMAGRELVTRLRNAGHDVEIPADVGLVGESDPIQFTHAVSNRRILLTRNAQDFDIVHDLIAAASGHHPGLLCMGSDNDSSKDLTPGGIVVAIGHLLASGLSLEDGRHYVNHWR